MKIIHPSIISPIFELIKVIEFDICFGDESWTIRIELLQDTEKKDFFRCNMWEKELFRLTPSFPRNKKGNPAHITDDYIMIERPFPISTLEYKGFVASSPEKALELIFDNFKEYLKHVTGVDAQ